MLQFRRTFETEKHQLQELNNRLGNYLSRTQQLEHENGCLVAEINKLRQAKTVGKQNTYKAEMRELRGMVGQLSFEKSQAEMERERLWRELQTIQSMCREETEVSRDIGGEMTGCEKELQQVLQTNGALEQRLTQLETEYERTEEAHRRESAHVRSQVHSRVVPVLQTYQGPPAASMEDVQEYARSLSEGWIDTYEMYQQRVEEMERSIKTDQGKLDEFQREKMLYASEFDQLRADAEKQNQAQLHLQGELGQMQDKFRVELNQYQIIMEELEHERNMLAHNMAEQMRDHQHLLQVKMDLGMEVAAYRALLEGERIDIQEAQRRVHQHQRERIIDIKVPSQPYAPRVSTSSRQHLDVRHTEQTSSLRRSPVPNSGSMSPSRVIPISITGRASQHQSPASRRDMVSFTKARAGAAVTTSTENPAAQSPSRSAQDVQRKVAEEKSVKVKAVSQLSVSGKSSPVVSPAADLRSVRVIEPPTRSLVGNTEVDAERKARDDRKESGNAYGSDTEDKGGVERRVVARREKKISESVEDIIEKVMRPAGLDSSSGDKITYHVERTEQEDGTTKTQIVLESKVEEELDLSEDSVLDDLFGRGTKKMTLEDIKGTATGTMIQDLLSSLQGAEDFGNKSVNVEIIEEPVESQSDEEDDDFELESLPEFAQLSSTFCQIEELENMPHDLEHHRSGDDSLKSPKTVHGKNGPVPVQEASRGNEFLYVPDSQEYFVSTPEENLSEPEDGGSITSYGHYGIVDDLSDERYYQDEGIPANRMTPEKNDDYKFMSSDFVQGESFPECIIEEEVHVSPTVQESMLEFLKEDSLDPKDQLKGALEKLQGSMSGPLKDELAFLTRVSGADSPNLSVHVKKLQQSNDNGTTTIVAEMNISQTLEESGLLDTEGDDLSEEQIMAALRSSHPEFLQSGAEGGYSLRFSRDEHVLSSEPAPQYHTVDQPLKVSDEKRIATVYLDSPTDD